MALDETPGSATGPQIDYIRGLSGKKNLQDTRLTDEQREYLTNGDLTLLSKAQASKVIELLLKLDWINNKPQAAPIPFDNRLPAGATSEEYQEEGIHHLTHSEADRLPALGDTMGIDPTPVRGLERAGADFEDTLRQLENEIRAARYFIVDPTNNEERFFKVSKPVDWKGNPTGEVNLEVQASDYFYPVTDAKHRMAVYREIQKDPTNAMNLYGIKLGVCGVCGRTLTDRDSILRGIGPICASRLMMEDAQATDEQLDMLTKLGIRKSEE
jgi:Family of unknown function (DUF6011)